MGPEWHTVYNLHPHSTKNNTPPQIEYRIMPQTLVPRYNSVVWDIRIDSLAPFDYADISVRIPAREHLPKLSVLLAQLSSKSTPSVCISQPPSWPHLASAHAQQLDPCLFVSSSELDDL